MLLGWDQSRPPDPPYCTTIDVTSVNSVTIRIQESTEGAITTKFKSTYISIIHKINFETFAFVILNYWFQYYTRFIPWKTYSTNPHLYYILYFYFFVWVHLKWDKVSLFSLYIYIYINTNKVILIIDINDK